jgi:iron complex outermembrane receptor protein
MKRTALFLGILLAALAARADDVTPPRPAAGEDKELAELLSIVQQETDVATKTKMNSDYVPGIVTVLEGDELEALGIENAGEALGLVPGIFSVRDRLSNRSVIARGLDFPFNNGNILILINSIPITRPDAGITTSALLVPVAQIERIEVIRGPGSVVYGDFAFMGLVNIITRRAGTGAYARINSPHRAFDTGAHGAWTAGATKFSVNLSRFTSSNFGAVQPFASVDDNRWFGVATVERGRFSAGVQTVRRSYDANAPANQFDETSTVVDAKYAQPLATKLDATFRATYLRNDLTEPASSFAGKLLKVGADVVWNGMNRNAWLGGVDYTVSKIDNGAFVTPPPPGQPLPRRIPLAHDISRRIEGVYLQDRIDVLDNVSLTLGGRYDAYSDLESRFTPRVAVAWRINDSHILKAQYTEGFRPPTFFEQYLPPAPGSIPRYYFETNATTELNYVYRAAGRVGRATLFHEVITNMIRPGGFITDPNAKADGAELEWSQQIATPLKVDANVSYTETEDPRAIGAGAPRLPNPLAPKWLGNLVVLYRPLRTVVFTTRLSHVGERPRTNGFDLVDFAVTKQDVVVRGLDVRAGIHNAFDQAETYVLVRPTNETNFLHFPGRSVWLQLSWSR